MFLQLMHFLFIFAYRSNMEVLGCCHNAKDLLGLQCVSIKMKQPKPASARVTSNKVVFNYEPRSFPQGLCRLYGGFSTPVTRLVHCLSI